MSDPTDRELILNTAEEWLSAIGADDVASREAQEAWVSRTDLRFEIKAQEELIDDLIAQYEEHPDEGTAQAIEEAKFDLGSMLVDRLNQPPA